MRAVLSARPRRALCALLATFVLFPTAAGAATQGEIDTAIGNAAQWLRA